MQIELPPKRIQVRPGALATFNETFLVFNEHVFKRPSKGMESAVVAGVLPAYLPHDVRSCATLQPLLQPFSSQGPVPWGMVGG